MYVQNGEKSNKLYQPMRKIKMKQYCCVSSLITKLTQIRIDYTKTTKP